jgi:hypothetical protein
MFLQKYIKICEQIGSQTWKTIWRTFIVTKYLESFYFCDHICSQKNNMSFLTDTVIKNLKSFKKM